MKKIIIGLALSSAMFSQTTMCYVEGIKKPSQLENTKLNGGECAGKESIKDMEAKGWNIKDISMTKDTQNATIDYSYVFEKNNSINTNISNTTIKDIKIKNDLEEGKKLYVKNCQSCHGIDGKKKPNSSDKLTTLTSEDFKDEMRAYTLNELDKGSAIIMNPYVTGADDTDKIANYLQSIGVFK